MLKDIQDEPLLNGLLHRIIVKRLMLNFAFRFIRHAKHFKSFILWGSGKCEITGILKHLSTFKDTIDFILGGFFLSLFVVRGKSHIHFSRHITALAGMCFIDDDCKIILSMRCPNVVKDVWKFMNYRYNNLLTIL